LISKQPVSIDWIYRYEPVLDFLLENHLEESKILDFGCGNVGLGSVFSGNYFGVDLAPITPEVPNLIRIDNVHPFSLNDPYDLVCAVDVMEHVPVQDRENFFQTMQKIVKKYLILAFPAGDVGCNFDVETATFINAGGNLPTWLLEHLALEHPHVESVLGMAKRYGFKLVKHVKNTHRIMHYLGCIGLFVGGDMKVTFMNDIHYLNELHKSENGMDMYRSVLFLRASS
jgi:hypothetical protein